MQLPAAQAAVPKLLSYQGVLKDDSGNLLTGTYSMTFRLYSAATGGTALWTETHSSVSTTSGKFNVELGGVTTLNLDFNSDYWLSIEVASDGEMSPRVRLTSSGYSVRSDYENNGFTQSAHDALSHKSIEGVSDNSILIAKTNFKLDAYTLAAANSMGDLLVDTFNDASGIDSGSSSNYTYRGSPNYDVVLTPGGIDSYAVLVLHANGTDASTTFTDSSDSTHSVTANGDAQIDTAQSKFGGASALFDGTGDYLSVADSADWDFGTGDFTIDFWVRFNTVDWYRLFEIGTYSSDGVGLQYDGSTLYFEINGGSTSASWSPSAGTWYHLAFVRTGSTVRLFVDGTQLGSDGTNSGNVTGGTAGASIGGWHTETTRKLNGWMDEVRISKGIARWTSNFTPPSAEYSSASGTATVISNAYSEPVAPVEAMVVVDETLNSGSITYHVSRDNGTNWTQCTKETVTDISSQPSGTQVKWKAVITDDAELNAIAVAL